ncbi:MAG: nucleotide sugar dehydrogenase [Helicobacter sp.]|nr:nucleotide sugar dehydrogenase [Helicobacteraceae bacterium]MDY3113389.1 nucleotide sugar dehydrogenase [Helicobacter sp.]
MKTLAIIGLGYVGLPLAVEFGKKQSVIGFDIYKQRIEELKNNYDRTLEVESCELKEAKNLRFTTQLQDLKEAQIFIVTVPTPIDNCNKPDLTPIQKATQSIASVLKKGDIVIYESTVYPGCTEEFCVPILEEISGLKFNIDFFCGYSPERINPGDKEHRLPSIKKVTSGSTPQIATEIDELYKSIITAGTHKASSIKVAEAAKVIENSQRDINIAFVNELALIFDKIGIDTLEVLEAAGSKWNFLPFRPGLVGGHCIGVDPYYLTHKAESLGYHSQVILAGRRINDNMGIVVANKVIKLLANNKSQIVGAKIAILGITFKENCPDIRNSRVVDIAKELLSFECVVDIYDPLAQNEEVQKEYGLTLKDLKEFKTQDYNAVIIAVAHKEFKEIDFNNKGKTILYDLKGILPKDKVDGRL